ncbi:hypothetical protein [Yoonia sp. 2307UL14-13]|uniref:hypothetical protein n=1 Tax=Yoonia sp. 2307UL14-13 TaxID=3126506 RepID=UPI0030951CC8
MFFPDALRATFPENWPDALKELSIPGVEVALTSEDVTVLGHFNAFYMKHHVYSGQSTLSEEAQEAIHAALDKYPDGVMPRLGLCSWKASTLVHEPARNFGDVMRTITQDDRRIGRALSACAVADEGAVLHLRKWVDIPPWSEFRIFVKAGKIQGISQYFYKERFVEITDNIVRINAALYEFAQSHIAKLPLDTVIADVFVGAEPTRDLTGSDVVLIELNPFGEGTDPCLFSWRDPEGFDGRLRYLN